MVSGEQSPSENVRYSQPLGESGGSGVKEYWSNGVMEIKISKLAESLKSLQHSTTPDSLRLCQLGRPRHDTLMDYFLLRRMVNCHQPLY